MSVPQSKWIGFGVVEMGSQASALFEMSLVDSNAHWDGDVLV